MLVLRSLTVAAACCVALSGCADGKSGGGDADSGGGGLGACVSSFNDAVGDEGSAVGGSWGTVSSALDDSDVTGSVARQGDECWARVNVSNGSEGVSMVFKGDMDGGWSLEDTGVGTGGEAGGLDGPAIDETSDADVDEDGLSL